MTVCRFCGKSLPVWETLTEEDQFALLVLLGIRPECPECLAKRKMKRFYR